MTREQFIAQYDGEQAPRGGRFSPNRPVGLAGSDMTHFFLSERDPQHGTSIIIATTNAAFQGPRVRLAIEVALIGRVDAANGVIAPFADRLLVGVDDDGVDAHRHGRIRTTRRVPRGHHELHTGKIAVDILASQ